MGLKQRIEDHIAIVFLATLLTGFLAGWKVNDYLNTRQGLVLVPSSERGEAETLRQNLVDKDKEFSLARIDAERLRNELAACKQAADKSEALARSRTPPVSRGPKEQTYYLNNHGQGTKEKQLGKWIECSDGPPKVNQQGGYHCETVPGAGGTWTLRARIDDQKADVTCSAICVR